MNILKVTIASREDVSRRTLAAFSGKGHGEQLSFPTPELLWKVLGAKRWELLKAMAGKGPMTLRAAARAVGRNVKAVHGDVHALLDAGVIERAEDGKIVFRRDAIHVDFMLSAA